MIKLKHIYIKDFMSIKEAKVRFSHTGLYFISGYDEAGGDSNGAGKSSVLAAICWVIFGKTQKGLIGNQVVRWGARDTEVILHLIDGEHGLEIRRTTHITELSIDGAKVKGLKLDVQSQINETLHTDYNTFVSCVMFTRGQVDFLADSGDSAKKKLFKNILGLERLDKAYDFCKEKLDGYKQEADGLDLLWKSKTVMLTKSTTDIAEFEEREANADLEKDAEIKHIKEKIQLLPKPKVKDFVKESERLTKELNSLNKKDYPSQFDKVYKERQLMIKEQIANTLTKESNRDALKILWDLEDDTRCFTCGSELTPEGKVRYAKELKKAITDGEETEQHLQKIIDELSIKLEKINENTNTTHNIEHDLMILEHNATTHEKDMKTYESYIKEYKEQLDKIEDRKSQYAEIIEKLESARVTLQKEIEEIEANLKKSTLAVDYYSYLYWMFSRTGVVSYIVDRSFGRLQTLTNRFLKNVARAGFTIEISPQKELKSGKVTDNITISVITNDKKVSYDNLSAGQQQRINVSLLMAIFIWSREVGANKFDFMLLDEVLDLSLAKQGQKDMVEFVGNMLKYINQIIVISHRDAIPDKSYKEIHIRRNKEGISEITGG